ncbi:MAG: acetyl-CoA C-acetyltransferase [Halieaceae bacterium]|nr:acetyl-CoA C-acetyltransferase [Halieaceae bacterium]
MAEAWIIDACRTPRGIGKPEKGALAHLHPQHLGATVLKAIAERNDLNTAEVDDIVWGTSAQRGTQKGDLGRMAALAAGYDIRSSAVTLDRFCGSGITSVNMAATSIMAGMEDCTIGGGTEMMSLYGGFADQSPFIDSDNLDLREMHPQPHQGVCGDAIATLEGIDREAVDALAVVSQQNADRAIKEGRFDKSLIPVHNPDGSLALDQEQFPRPQTTMESLAALDPSFERLADYPLDEAGTTFRALVKKKFPDLEINHVHHAGNSSGVVDGAAAVLMASPEYAKAQGWKPRARIVAMANMGDDPTLMLNAPVPAARKVLAKAGMTLEDIDLFEINEAFSVVAERFIRHLDLDRDKVNVNGGAMALGHPIGATGSILIGTMVDELERADKQFGLVTMCAAGGMAPAVIIERVAG